MVIDLHAKYQVNIHKSLGKKSGKLILRTDRRMDRLIDGQSANLKSASASPEGIKKLLQENDADNDNSTMHVFFVKQQAKYMYVPPIWMMRVECDPFFPLCYILPVPLASLISSSQHPLSALKTSNS